MATEHTNLPEQQEPGEKRVETFPGYPHYDKKEDIMDGRNEAERVNINVEELPNFHNATTPHRLIPGMSEANSESAPADSHAGMNGDLGIKMGTDADISADEKKMLDDEMYYPSQDEDRLRQARLDDTDFDGEKLNEESFGAGQAETGADLDMDTDNEEILSEGEGDEENQYFSLGNEDNENITEGNP